MATVWAALMASSAPLYTTIQAESSICVPPFGSVWVKGSLQRLDVKAEVLLHQVKVDGVLMLAGIQILQRRRELHIIILSGDALG